MAKTTLPVLDMSCVVCAGNVEHTVNALDGVNTASVNFAANTITIDYNPKKITLAGIKKAVQDAGYDLVIEQEKSAGEEAEKKSYRALRRKLVAAWALAVPVMIISMAGNGEKWRWTSCSIMYGES